MLSLRSRPHAPFARIASISATSIEPRSAIRASSGKTSSSTKRRTRAFRSAISGGSSGDDSRSETSLQKRSATTASACAQRRGRRRARTRRSCGPCSARRAAGPKRDRRRRRPRACRSRRRTRSRGRSGREARPTSRSPQQRRPTIGSSGGISIGVMSVVHANSGGCSASQGSAAAARSDPLATSRCDARAPAVGVGLGGGKSTAIVISQCAGYVTRPLARPDQRRHDVGRREVRMPEVRPAAPLLAQPRIASSTIVAFSIALTAPPSRQCGWRDLGVARTARDGDRRVDRAAAGDPDVEAGRLGDDPRVGAHAARDEGEAAGARRLLVGDRADDQVAGEPDAQRARASRPPSTMRRDAALHVARAAAVEVPVAHSAERVRLVQRSRGSSDTTSMWPLRSRLRPPPRRRSARSAGAGRRSRARTARGARARPRRPAPRRRPSRRRSRAAPRGAPAAPPRRAPGRPARAPSCRSAISAEASATSSSRPRAIASTTSCSRGLSGMAGILTHPVGASKARAVGSVGGPAGAARYGAST